MLETPPVTNDHLALEIVIFYSMDDQLI